MNPQISQDSGNPMKSSDQSAAALAFATQLSEGLMPKAPQEAQQGETLDFPQENQDAPQEQPSEPQPTQETPQEPEPNKEIETLTKDFDVFKGKIEGIIETKFNDLTKTLKDALTSD